MTAAVVLLLVFLLLVGVAVIACCVMAGQTDPLTMPENDVRWDARRHWRDGGDR